MESGKVSKHITYTYIYTYYGRVILKSKSNINIMLWTEKHTEKKYIVYYTKINE